MISEIFVKIAAIVLLAAVAVVLILGIRTLFKGDGDKKTSNKLMQLKSFTAICCYNCARSISLLL